MRSLFPIILLASAAFSFTGVIKGFLNVEEDLWNSSFPLRIMERRNIGPGRFEAAWALSPSFGDPAVAGPVPSYTDYRLKDFSPRIVPEDWQGDENFSLNQNLDRLSLQFRPLGLRVTAGRQAIYWGVSKTVSPTDFIAPFPYGTIDTEYRVGVDAVRAVYPAGVLSEIEAGAVFGENAKNNGYWARGRFYALNTDLTVLGAGFSGTFMAGGSLNRAIGGAVVWGEGAWSRHQSGISWWNMSAGAERSFLQSSIYCFLEYHHNSAGAGDPEDYTAITANEAYRNGTVYLLGKNYLSAGCSYFATPLLTFSATGLLNMGDLSSRMSLEGEYSLSENSVLTGGISMGGGPRENEFGDVPLQSHAVYSLYF